MSDLIHPSELGFSDKFPNWREGQLDALLDMVDCPTRFSCSSAPTGFGKSPIYVGTAQATGVRTLILTVYKGLQSQITDDWSFIADIRGKSNYWCATNNMNCEQAGPRCDERASILGNFCPHKQAIAKASEANVVVTNYSCWLHSQYGKGFGEFDQLVCDEAHDSPEELSKFLAFDLDSREVFQELKGYRNPSWMAPIREWKDWALDVHEYLSNQLDIAQKIAKNLNDQDSLKRAFYLRALHKKVTTLSKLSIDAWVCENTASGIRFDPIWPGNFAEHHLFRGIPRVMLFSATLTRKTPHLLGIKDTENTFYEYPSPFPIQRSPLYLLPAGSMSHNNLVKNPEVFNNAVRLMDRTVDARLDRKGINHTQSFTHLDDYLSWTKHRDIVLANDIRYLGGNRKTMELVQTFKQSSPPAILASPSISTGFDFPDDECRYQMILKVPFPDATSLVDKKRREIDPDYHNHIAMTTLIQICGRPVRSIKDWAETFIFDNRIGWFLATKGYLAPGWFISKNGIFRFRKMGFDVIPEPMKP